MTALAQLQTALDCGYDDHHSLGWPGLSADLMGQNYMRQKHCEDLLWALNEKNYPDNDTI